MSLLYLRASFCWYSASHIVTNSRYSSNKFNYFNINSEFFDGVKSETRALHKFISADITTFAPYVKENGVSPMDLLRVVQYAYKTLAIALWIHRGRISVRDTEAITKFVEYPAIKLQFIVWR